MLPIYSHRAKGFGLIELLIAMSLSGVLAIGAYKFVGNSTKNSFQSMNKTSDIMSENKALDSIALTLRNVPPIAGNDKGHPLRLKTLNTSTSIPVAIQIFPGMEKSQLNALMTEPLDISKSYLDISSLNEDDIKDKKSDAIRFVSLDSSSGVYQIALDLSTNPPLPFDITGFNNLTIETPHNSPAKSPFSNGDFVLISDGSSSVITRLTSAPVPLSVPTPIGKNVDIWSVARSENGSAWNKEIEADFGVSNAKYTHEVSIQKVKIFTYANDTSNNDHTLYVYDHSYDDQFDPQTKAYGGGSTEKGWSKLLENVESFKINSIFSWDTIMDSKNCLSNHVCTRRVPYIESFDKNSLGSIRKIDDELIGLRQLEILITSNKKTIRRLINPYERAGEATTPPNNLTAATFDNGILETIEPNCPEGFKTKFGQVPSDGCSPTVNPTATKPSGEYGVCCGNHNATTCETMCAYIPAPPGGFQVSNESFWRESANISGGGN